MWENNLGEPDSWEIRLGNINKIVVRPVGGGNALIFRIVWNIESSTGGSFKIMLD